MSEDLPAPLVPPDVDLRGNEWMPYYGNHLARSEFNAHASDAVFRAGHNLWWAAWNNVPAASLPDDDVALTRFADLGRDVRAFRKIKADALHGFIKCSDGRLYHPFLAKLATDAWGRRVKERDRKARWRRSKDGDGDGDAIGTDTSPTRPPDSPGTAERKRQDRTGQEKTGKEPVEESRKRASRLPGDFIVPMEWREHARKARERNRLPPVDLNLEAEKFTNFWLSKGGKDGAKTDWHRTWINWALGAKGSNDGKQFRRANGTSGSADWWDVPKPPTPQSPPPVPRGERD